MKDEINLSLAGKVKKERNALFLFSALVFIACFIISAILLLYSLSQSARLSDLQESETELRGKIAARAATKAKLLSINERLASINKVISARKDISERANAVIALTNDDFTVNSFSVDNASVNVSLASASLASFDTLLEGVIPRFAKDKPMGLQNINMTSFSDNEAGYVATLNFQFKEKK